MKSPEEPSAPEPRVVAPRAEARWARLLGRETPDGALREVASWFDSPELLELTLEAPGGPVARYLHPAAASCGETVVAEAAVCGRPEWWLRGRWSGPVTASEDLARRAAEPLEIWRAARLERARVEARLEARTRELVLLQSLGRAAAEARDVPGLLGAAAAVLHEASGAEVVAMLHALGGNPEALAFTAGEIEAEELLRLLGGAAGLPGWDGEARPRLEVRRLGDHDGTSPAPLALADPLRAPLSRRGRTVAVLVVVFGGPDGERARRLLYVAANELSLHLDRILTVREGEQLRFRAILDSMPQAVLLTDGELRVLEANPAARRWLDRLAGEGAERLTRVGRTDLRPLAREALEAASRAASALARLEDGTRLSASVSVLRAGAGEAGELVVVLSDVTEEHRIQERLAQAEKLTSLGRMISGVAHELNNPLAAVLGYTQLALAEVTDEKAARRARLVHEEARRCQRIVQTLLRFARSHEPERKPVSLGEVVQAVLALMGYQLRVDGIEARAEIAPDVPSVIGDAHELQQVLVNLITNAQQAIREARRGGAVTIRAARCGGAAVTLEIEDDGPGIPEAIRSRIFDPFFTTKPAGAGTGLGLSLVYGAVVSHGGTIRVESGERRGARFRIELPAARRESGSPPPGPAAGEPRRRGPGGRILVVDDEERVARLICEALAADGHLCEPVTSAREALDRAAVAAFDLVISDVRMPGMDGLDLREALDRVRPGLSRRVLLTTGDTVGQPVAKRLAPEDASDVLQKPFDLDDLRRAVRSRLERSP